MKLSIIIPTLNSSTVLEKCLNSINKQNFTDYEIIIVDGGSSDTTIKTALKYNCKIIHNPYKTAEAGKSIGLKRSRGDFIAFIDSDNILPDNNWISQMLEPFDDPQILVSEPIKFTYRPEGGFIERYCSLFGANDPYCIIAGNYDRFSYYSQKWTGLNLKYIDNHKYLKIYLSPNYSIPTIGANGTFFRSNFFEKKQLPQYLFDIDILTNKINQGHTIIIAKVKIGIIHTYCEDSIQKFIRKQYRRITDYYTYRSIREYRWIGNNLYTLPRFIMSTLSIVFPLYQSIVGFLKKPDLAWFFHLPACSLTLAIYGMVTIKYKLGLQRPLDRKSWKQ